MANPQSGYIALITVLVTGAVATAVSLTLLVGGTDLLRSGQVETGSIQARSLATGCAEEALQVIHDSTSYTGSGSLTLGLGTCIYTVTSTGTLTRTITTSGTINSIIRKVVVYVTINASNISIISWQEVS